MAKGQKRSSREPKKPKAAKPKPAASTALEFAKSQTEIKTGMRGPKAKR
jgi:hypothetical protein